jgi:hypothetical protein
VAVNGWLLDKSAAVRRPDPTVGPQLRELSDRLFICPIGELEQLYSARSGMDYDTLREDLYAGLQRVSPPPDVFERALELQRDLAHHRGLWHRIPIPDLLIAETALYQALGVVTVDSDFERIAEVRPLEVLRLG